jgi:putative redox protein
MVAAALASCTVMTMRLYARRKGWNVPKLSAAVRHVKRSVSARDRFELIIRLEPAMHPDWRARLLEMARRCPVHSLLAPGAEIVTHVTSSELPFPLTDALHAKILDELCQSSGRGAEAA